MTETERLRAALEPFARFAVDPSRADDVVFLASWPDGQKDEAIITAADFRRAAAALSPAPAAEPDEAAKPDACKVVCDEIQSIMRTYREQAASPGGVDTPGGLEHMGDVWRLLAKWDAAIERREGNRG